MLASPRMAESDQTPSLPDERPKLNVPERTNGGLVATTTPLSSPSAASSKPFSAAVFALLLLVVVSAVFVLWSQGGGGTLAFPHSIDTIGQTLAPLIAIAAFIERAVEVFIAPWRDPGALALQGPALDRYKIQTQTYAFSVSLGLSLFASMVGVRGVSALVDPSALPPHQRMWFTVFDEIITSLLLAGGSDGIHQLVTTITTFLDKSKEKTKQP